METKNNIILIVILIIFIIVSLILGGIIIYDKILIDDENKDIINNNLSLENNDNSNVVEQKQDFYQVLNLSPIGGMAVLYNGEVYVDVYDSTTMIDKVYVEGKFQTLIKTRENYKEYNFGDLNVVTENPYSDNTINSSKWLKLNIQDVEAIYNNKYGQAISPVDPKYGIIMLNKDKTVSYISINELIAGNVNPVKLPADNIDKIVYENNMGYTTFIIYSDGYKINVNALISGNN